MTTRSWVYCSLVAEVQYCYLKRDDHRLLADYYFFLDRFQMVKPGFLDELSFHIY
jgi:hypothetical protein